jgi:hypothetical protein
MAIMWKNKERSVDLGGIYGLSRIQHVTLQKIVAHDFRYDPCIWLLLMYKTTTWLLHYIYTVLSFLLPHCDC